MRWLTASNGIPLNDRGVAYGDGLFETLRINNGRLPWLQRHLQRLEQGLARLAISGVEREALEHRLQHTAARSDIATGWLKLIVTRGGGERGYAPAADAQPHLIVQTGSIEPCVASLRLLVCKTLLPQDSQLAGLKHLNRLPQVLAAAELAPATADEGLMCNAQGILVCGIMHNVFIVTDKGILTPSLEQGGVAGIMRRWVLDALPVRIDTITPAMLTTAREVFVTNAVRGVRSASHVGDNALPEHTCVADELRQRLHGEWL